jgi:hypothetical protein
MAQPRVKPIVNEIIARWRKDFEDQFSGAFTGHRLAINDFGAYSEPWIEFLWKGFLMGRSSVAVHVPPLIMVNGDLWVEPSELHDCISDQGYAVENFAVKSLSAN